MITSENRIFQVFLHFANFMYRYLCIVTYVFGHQESIAATSLILNTKND